MGEASRGNPGPDHPVSRERLGGWRRVADGVHVVVAEPDTVNLVVVAGRDGALIVDTGSSAAQGRAVRAAVSTVTPVPVVAAVVTHAHLDHAGGLGAFADVPIYGHESVADARIWGGSAPTPSRPLAVAAALDLGGRRVEIAHLGRGHTAGDLVVVLPDADLVLAGDLIEPAAAPWWGADSFPHEWPATVDNLLGLMTAQTRAVPGHGAAVDREWVFAERGRIAAVSGEIRRLAESGVPASEAEAAGSWSYPADHISAGIVPGYAHLGPVAVTPRRLPLA